MNRQKRIKELVKFLTSRKRFINEGYVIVPFHYMPFFEKWYHEGIQDFSFFEDVRGVIVDTFPNRPRHLQDVIFRIIFEDDKIVVGYETDGSGDDMDLTTIICRSKNK